MSFDQIASEALKLPTKERAILASSLWESIEDPFLIAFEQNDAEALTLAMQRDEELETGAVTPISHTEMMAFLRS